MAHEQDQATAAQALPQVRVVGAREGRGGERRGGEDESAPLDGNLRL
jgi:hypothetical protein